MRSTIEIYNNGAWIPAAEFTPLGSGPYTGVFEYRLDYVFGDNPLPISFALPINGDRRGLDAEGNAPPCPAFLLDLVPQGRGRVFLSQELKIAGGERDDLLLAQYGAFNPIGNLRIDTAVAFYEERSKTTGENAGQGFTINDIVGKKDEFLDHLVLHAMLPAGTSGVQGAAPKFLLTQDRAGLWFADAALPDNEATKHWLVKLPRGTHETDVLVLRNEAAYARVARQCGLRCHGEAMLYNDMLFVERFDRQVNDTGLHRLHQESLASLANLRGFGVPASLFDLAAAFQPHVTHPVRETIEFMARDILNMALRNTDNHARNSAVQRLPNGEIRLTPLYDVAPMYMDREFIVRGCKWRTGDGKEILDWGDIIGALNFSDTEKRCIALNLKEFLAHVQALPETMRDCGVNVQIIDDCKGTIEAQADRLERLGVNALGKAEFPAPKSRHVGVVLKAEDGVLIQDAGGGKLVAHEEAAFGECVPIVGDRLDVSYSRDGVPTVLAAKGRGHQLGR